MKKIIDIKKANIEKLNAMQLASIECAKTESEIVLLSKTGSGKTLAYLIPLVERMQQTETNSTSLVIAPTRELVIQIEKMLRDVSENIRILSCYGGHPFSSERRSLENELDIIIGTPGRLADHIRRETINISNIESLVIDEYDKCLEFGFHNEMSQIVEKLDFLDLKILTSATIIDQLPDFMNVKSVKTLNFLERRKEASHFKMMLVETENRDKLYDLYKLISNFQEAKTIVFVNHRESAVRVYDYLKTKNIESEYFHGGLEQNERERRLFKFRSSCCNFLISTDLSARGLDIEGIENIIHYHLPSSSESYIHRNGRTARMNNRGAGYIIKTVDDELPEYIYDYTKISNEILNEEILPPESICLFIAKGKKDKIRKIDLVGFFMKEGGLNKSELGLIDVKDYCSYIAVNRKKHKKLLKTISNKKIKNRPIKVKISY
ncbi:MAG: DEAD/DEAH box helicase [Marinifilaceae bacterium]|jgi:superfamily II DNA/RNA helicase|nr:DEAD/DEAH box helicase [Marinifilaceae bacterium]